MDLTVDPARAARVALRSCCLAALLALVAASAFGEVRFGAAFGAGLVVGAFNAQVTLRSFAPGRSFRLIGMLRLSVLSILGLGLGIGLTPGTPWIPVLGIALAQFVQSAVALRAVMQA